ncbi:hypothetical protein B9Z44_09840 [Limnohabitans curvus]|uniref:Uncharacterized protein n=1 Tax=Limnohabitans curvus TaxID=323423 RepID=A0A315EV63_9BURK|nr:hypothetical protein [Limnohabitans curvus]PUE59852.1 hypothetical protein B9Z44_09840 [Limnohabitans curvus]
MAEEQNTTEDAAAPAEAIVDVEATADRLTEIASQSLDTSEVARQIEELTSVVLDSAEVSTRSASIAADVSATMRAVVSKIQENNRRNVMHSRIMLGAFCACLLIAMGVFFAITLKMTKSIKELDTMVYAMAKRVIEVDASLTAIGKTNSDFSEITEKQEEVITTQTQVAKRLEEIGKSMAAMPAVVAVEANKSSDLKFKDMQKQLTGLESKLQSFDSKLQSVAEKASSRAPAPAPATSQGPSTQVLLTEIQKIKSDLNAAVQVRERTQTAAEATAIKNIEKTVDKAAAAAGDAQKAADKAAQSAKAAADAQKAAAASEKASAAERLAQQKAAAERAVAMRMQPEKPEKSAEQIAAERAAAERAAAARAAKAAADKAAADKAAAAERAAEKARAASAAAAATQPVIVREKPIQYPRAAD